MYEYNEHRIVTELYGHDEKAEQDVARIRQAIREKGEARQVVIATVGVIPSKATPFVMIVAPKRLVRAQCIQTVECFSYCSFCFRF